MKLSKWLIKGLFSGRNQALTYAQDMKIPSFLILDTAKLYGNTSNQTATYEDATFFAAGSDLDQLIEKSKPLIIPWNYFDLVKSSSNYPACKIHQ